jgi:hypothetical protein
MRRPIAGGVDARPFPPSATGRGPAGEVRRRPMGSGDHPSSCGGTIGAMLCAVRFTPARISGRYDVPSGRRRIARPAQGA